MILLAGGTGFIGGALARHLADRGYNVRTVSRSAVGPATLSPGSAEHYCRDVASLSPHDAVFDGVSAVVNLMSATSPARSMSSSPQDTVKGLLPDINLFDCIRARRVAKFVFISSGGTVYGIPKQLPVREDHPTDPISPYGISKLAAEKYCAVYCEAICNWYALRISNAYGPGQLVGTEIGAIAGFVRRHAKGLPVEVWGDGTIIRDYVFIDDILDAIRRLLDGANIGSGVYNLGSGSGHSLLQLIDLISQISRTKVSVRFAPARAVDVPAIVLDIHRVKSATGWAPTTSFEAGVKTMWEQANAPPCPST
jgi:UDP-glucose 4-epimerase